MPLNLLGGTHFNLKASHVLAQRTRRMVRAVRGGHLHLRILCNIVHLKGQVSKLETFRIGAVASFFIMHDP